MSNFRAIAPQSKKILELQYNKPTVHILGDRVNLYQCKPRANEVIKLQILLPVSTLFQHQKLQARTASSLALSGTSQFTSDQIQEQFEFWGTTVNMDTHIFGTEFTLKATKEHFEASLDWFLKNLKDTIYPQEELAVFQQTEIASMQRKMTTPKYWSNRICMENLFGTNSPMTSYADIEDISKLFPDELRAFHNLYLNPSFGKWYLSGDTDEDIISQIDVLIQRHCTNTEMPTNATRPKEYQPTGALSIKHAVENTSQVSMLMAREIPAIDEVQIHKLSLLNLILGGFFGSRLMQEIREEQGLTYGIGSYISQTTRGNMWVVSGEMNSAHAEKALDATKELMRSLVSNPPTGAELDRAKSYYAGHVRGSFDGPFAMATKLKNIHLRGFGYNHFDTSLSTIWATTTEELCALADNYLNPDTFYSVLAGEIDS